jgi:aspartyl-tRNA(Asn)/glutamyl-tRNA(Gln) amidotransferase subunit C
MSIEESELARIAELARIRIDPAEVAEVTRRITSVLDLVDQMQATDTSGVEPMANPLDAGQRLRRDEVLEDDRRSEFQAIAPEVEDGLYLVPKVID